MATIIDSLLVTLGLDASAFKKGTQEVQKSQKDFVALTKKGNKELSDLDSKAAAARAKNAKEMQAQGKKAVETFVSMRNQALSLLAVFTAGMGIAAFAKSTVFTSAALGRLSKNVDISTNELGGWALAAKEMGGSAEGMMSDINNVSQSLARFRAGMPDTGIQSFFQFGGGSQNGELKDTKSYLFAMADLLSKINKVDPAKAQMVANSMGLSYDAFNLMKQGGSSLRTQIELNSQLAGITEKNAEEAQKAQKAWAELSATLEKLGREILFPLLTELNNWMTAHQADIVKGIKEFIAKANSAADAIGGWKNVLMALIGLKVLSVVAPLLALGGALLRVGAGLASVAKFGSGIAGLLFSKDLNSSEDEEMAKMRQQSKSGTRGMRNNNPGNLRYGPFAKTHGAVGQDAKGFAIFPDMALGEYAAKSLLGSYFSRGHDTVRKVISRYAPSSENNTDAYINAVSKRLGVGADDKLNNSHISALSSAIFQHENGPGYSGSPISGLMRGRMRLSGVSNTNSSEVHIGQILVNTQASDARGIAGSIGSELRNSGYLVGQANTGMQ